MQLIENQPITSFKINDEEVFEHLFRAYYARLCAFAMSILDNKAEAEEAVQTMFCKIWEQRSSLDITGSVQAYLFRAVRNACLNHIKKNHIRDAYKIMNLDNLNQNPAFQPDRMTEWALGKQIEKAIAALPEQCRLVFKLSRFEEMKYKEIARTFEYFNQNRRESNGQSFEKIANRPR